MTRGKRFALNGVTWLSAVLCAAAFVLSIRGLWIDDHGVVGRLSHNLLFESVHGSFAFVGISDSRQPSEWGAAWISNPAPQGKNLLAICRWKLAGFGVGIWGPPGGGAIYRILALPSWFVCALFAALPVIRLARWHGRRGQQDQAVRCEKCGYDLRATPERCPECGRVAAG